MGTGCPRIWPPTGTIGVYYPWVGFELSSYLGWRRDPLELGASVEAAGDITAPKALLDLLCRIPAHPSMECSVLECLAVISGY
jgi:hypothetical protein